MSSNDLAGLGWSAHFLSQLDLDELTLTPARIAAVHRNRLEGLGPQGACDLAPAPGDSTGDYAVGDWVLCEGSRITRLLDRRSLLARRAAGADVQRQLIAANVDTVFIVTSCNADFNPRRIERYLALTAEAGAEAVVVLTKADMSAAPDDYRIRAESLSRGLIAVPLDARGPEAALALAPWCGKGRTVALLGSSGTGKTTLTNALTGLSEATAPIREDDARGRHTTTARALRPLPSGGWIIDTPGMRALRIADVAEGIEATFSEIAELAGQCRFRDCRHQGEPGCAVEAAVTEGRIGADRVASWRKLLAEERHNSQSLAASRDRARSFGRLTRNAMRDKRRMQGFDDSD